MKSFVGKHIVITGSFGYIGSTIIDKLLDIPCKITRVSQFNKKRTNVIEGDLTDKTFWVEILKKDVDIIFHLSAETSLSNCEESPSHSLKANVASTLAMIDAAYHLKVKPTIIYAGTATQVGLIDSLPVDEKARSHPTTIYDLHKTISEQHLQWYKEKGVILGTTLRLANVYGTGNSVSRNDRGIINKVIKNCLEGKRIQVFGDGNCIRDYIYIDNVAEAFLLAASHADKLTQPFYYIGSNTGQTIADAFNTIIERVKHETGKSNLVEYTDWPKNTFSIDKRNFVANSKSFQTTTGWKPTVDFIDGVDQTIQFFLSENSYEKRH